MTFTCTIEMGNDAMQRLEDIRQAIESSINGFGRDHNGTFAVAEAGNRRNIRDTNGNKVGEWKLSE